MEVGEEAELSPRSEETDGLVAEIYNADHGQSDGRGIHAISHTDRRYQSSTVI